MAICLNMIVKNEATVIRRCLNSVLPVIDSWVIVDTGSTDGTQEIISNCLEKIPGKLYERPWVDFSSNRNEALSLAKSSSDYFLFIDADDELLGDKTALKKPLEKDYYAVHYQKGICQTKRVLLASSSQSWRWEGIIHEALDLRVKQGGFLPDLYLRAGDGGCRSRDSKTLFQDIALLEVCLEKAPNDRRTLFHLAVFLEEAGQDLLSLERFTQRAHLGGSEEEVYYALFRMGALKEKLAFPSQEIIDSYSRACSFRPQRSEALVALAIYQAKQKNYETAYILLERALQNPLPEDTIYVAWNLYEYGALFLWADIAHQLGRYKETWDAYQKLLRHPKLPDSYRHIIEQNRLQVGARAALTKKIYPLSEFYNPSS